MAPYLLVFLNELKRLGQVVSEWKYVASKRPTLLLAAKNPSVGPLVLFDETEELTLEFGTKYHSHFDGQEADEYGLDRMTTAAVVAAKFVDRILRERVGVAVHYNDRGCIGAALIDLDEHGLTPSNLKNSAVGIYGGMIRTERFLWSGPVENPT